jgi:hypothetical protein
MMKHFVLLGGREGTLFRDRYTVQWTHSVVLQSPEQRTKHFYKIDEHRIGIVALARPGSREQTAANERAVWGSVHGSEHGKVAFISFVSKLERVRWISKSCWMKSSSRCLYFDGNSFN